MLCLMHVSVRATFIMEMRMQAFHPHPIFFIFKNIKIKYHHNILLSVAQKLSKHRANSRMLICFMPYFRLHIYLILFGFDTTWEHVYIFAFKKRFSLKELNK